MEFSKYATLDAEKIYDLCTGKISFGYNYYPMQIRWNSIEPDICGVYLMSDNNYSIVKDVLINTTIHVGHEGGYADNHKWMWNNKYYSWSKIREVLRAQYILPVNNSKELGLELQLFHYDNLPEDRNRLEVGDYVYASKESPYVLLEERHFVAQIVVEPTCPYMRPMLLVHGPEGDEYLSIREMVEVGFSFSKISEEDYWEDQYAE